MKLQALLDHTVKQIANIQEEVIPRLTPKQQSELMLISKWGCDGSSEHSQYKRKMDDKEGSVKNMFVTSAVPLQIISTRRTASQKVIVWQNARPSSPRYYCPIRLQFVRDTTLQEKTYIEHQIQQLQPSGITVNENHISIKYTLLFTVIYGKICNSVSSTTSTQKCYICGSTAKSFNNIDLM